MAVAPSGELPEGGGSDAERTAGSLHVAAGPVQAHGRGELLRLVEVDSGRARDGVNASSRGRSDRASAIFGARHGTAGSVWIPGKDPSIESSTMHCFLHPALQRGQAPRGLPVTSPEHVFHAVGANAKPVRECLEEVLRNMLGKTPVEAPRKRHPHPVLDVLPPGSSPRRHKHWSRIGEATSFTLIRL